MCRSCAGSGTVPQALLEKILINQTNFYPSGREILAHFCDKKQAICSNKPEEFVRRILASLGSLDLLRCYSWWRQLKI